MELNQYNKGFNDGLYVAVDLLQGVAKDLLNFEPGSDEDADLLMNLADVILEETKDVSADY
jgi:hypothetical protein